MIDPAHPPAGAAGGPVDPAPDELPGGSAPGPGATRDRLGAVAIVLGAVGIVFFGIGMAILTALVAAEAGKQARAERRSPENAYLALALAFVDGVVWVFLHYRFDVPIWIG